MPGAIVCNGRVPDWRPASSIMERRGFRPRTPGFLRDFMPYNFERQWQLARGHESKGDLVAAKDAYQAILRLEPDRLFVRLHLSNLEQATGHYRASREHALKAAETVRQGGRLKD